MRRRWGLRRSNCVLAGGHRHRLSGDDTETATDPSELVITYDGDACNYSGPDQVALGDEISLMFVNQSEDVISAGLNLIAPDRIDELVPLVGTDFDNSAETTLRPTLFQQIAGPGENMTIAFLPVEGTYVVDCTLLVEGFRVHNWWPAILEVTR